MVKSSSPRGNSMIIDTSCSFHNSHLNLRMLRMKAGDNRRHKASRNTRPHPDIDLPGQLALPLANVILRRAQLSRISLAR